MPELEEKARKWQAILSKMVATHAQKIA